MGERGGRERKEGTEELRFLRSFDLWSPWLHSVPRVKGSTLETSPRPFSSPVPPHPALVSATTPTPQEVTGASAGLSRGTSASSDPVHWPRAPGRLRSARWGHGLPFPFHQDWKPVQWWPGLCWMYPCHPETHFRMTTGVSDSNILSPFKAFLVSAFKGKKKVYHIRKCDQKLWFSCWLQFFSHHSNKKNKLLMG